MEVTEIRFSFASTKSGNGVCGFCMVVLDDRLIINRIVVSKDNKNNYVVHLPNIIKNNERQNILSFKDRQLEDNIKSAVLSEFQRLTSKNNGIYKYVKE